VNDSRTNPQKTAASLLAYLRQLKSDRGAMADLRRALNAAQRHRAWPLLARVGGIGDARVEAVAGFYAYHPDETRQGTLGTTCRRLAAENSSFEARFHRLLACDRDEICERVRPVILAARAKGFPVNYERLFTDLYYWGEKVKARWAQEYWGATGPEERTIATGTESTP
jgi:CRISPR type I-E-associated protein CasB/Cse2